MAPEKTGQNVDSEKPKPGKKPGTKGYPRQRDIGTDTQPLHLDIDNEDKICKCGAEYDLEDLPGAESYETHFEEKIVVRQYIRRKVVCRCSACGRFGGIKKAKKPSKLIRKSKYS